MPDLINIDALADALMQRIRAELHIGTRQPEPLAYTIQQAAQRLGLGLTTVKEMIAEHELEVVRRGKRVLIPRHSIEKWLKDRAT